MLDEADIAIMSKRTSIAPAVHWQSGLLRSSTYNKVETFQNKTQEIN
jgi:hypothetical protein